MKKYFLIIWIVSFVFAQSPTDMVLDCSITFDGEDALLSWRDTGGATSINIYRKAPDDEAWSSLASITSGDSIFIDRDIDIGEYYEYRVIANTSPQKEGYLLSGWDMDPVFEQGKIILLIDQIAADSLPYEIERLQNDLFNEGWEVVRYDIERDQTVIEIKENILFEFALEPENVKALLILGHVPVPYSGRINPDGHSDHIGAWPADVYYVDITGGYSDEYINDESASREANRNIPGDGKFDQSMIAGEALLYCGRIDFYDLPEFVESEYELLRRYLDKNHQYRIGNIRPAHRAIIDDNFGYFSGEAFAASGWKSYAPILGLDSVFSGDYFDGMDSSSYLFSYGCGGGSYTSCSGVGNSANFASRSPKSIFTMLFGSYFGDWDSQNNFLRSSLASDGWILTSCWAGRPHWQLHQMAMGFPIGYCAMNAQNNINLYPTNYGRQFVHIALLGDPTLKMNVIRPPSNLITEVIDSGFNVSLSWDHSPDSAVSYMIYRSNTERFELEVITEFAISENNYIDYSPGFGEKIYIVCAAKDIHARTGNYIGLSPGICDTVFVDEAVNEIVFETGFNLEIYPNPARDYVNLEIECSPRDGFEIALFDIKGRLLSQRFGDFSECTLDLTDFNPGIYLLSVRSGSHLILKKISIID